MYVTYNLPKEIINIILEYDGRIRYRNGKYIDQINKEDKMYECIKEKTKKDLELVKNINRYMEMSNYNYNWAIANNISMEDFDSHFNLKIYPHVKLNKLKDKTTYGMYFKFNYRMNRIYGCYFYKDISETFFYKLKRQLDIVSFLIIGTWIFTNESIFENKYVFK